MKTIIHVIECLTRGGAERVLVNCVNSLTNFRNIIVVLKDKNLFDEIYADKIICVDFKKGKEEKIEVVKRLKETIDDYKPDLIHSHLPLETYLIRKAIPKHIPLIFSVHNNYKKKFLKTPKIFFREKLGYRKGQIAIFVSEDAKRFYKKSIGLKGPSYVLHNFIDDFCYDLPKHDVSYNKDRTLKIVAAGNLREQKNYPYLLKSLALVKGLDFILDIYGEGNQKEILGSLINRLGLEGKVSLKGTIPNLELLDKLKDYDLYTMPSLHEGFSMALSEALILGMPCLVSSLPSLEETATKTGAIFVNISSEKNYADKLNKILEFPELLETAHKGALERAQTLMRKEDYISKLEEIYNFHISDNK